MSYSGSSYSEQESTTADLSELKFYQGFIFAVPIIFTFILLFFFYIFYLRRQRRLNWSIFTTNLNENQLQHDIARCELGLKKEVREMLPIIVFQQSFSVKDTQCSVCLGDYQADDKLQQIPACQHTFHMDCIDHWLATHTTCPLCRLSLLASTKADKTPEESRDIPLLNTGNDIEGSLHSCGQSSQDNPQLLNQ